MVNIRLIIAILIMITFSSILRAEFPICQFSNGQDFADVVWNGRKHLVVWSDNRGGDSDIYARFVSVLGDTFGAVFLIEDTTGAQYSTRVEYANNVFLIVWCDERSGEEDIYGIIVDSTGTPLGGSFPICTATGGQETPEVATDGINFLVVWRDRRTSNREIWGQIVSNSGLLVGSDFNISNTSFDEHYPTVCWGSDRYLVIWHDNSNSSKHVKAQMLSESGTAIGDPIVITSGNTWNERPSPSFDDAKFFVVWTRATYYGPPAPPPDDLAVYGRFVSLEGSLIDGSFSITGSADGRAKPRASWNGENYMVVWEDQRSSPYDIYAQRVDSNGVNIDEEIAVCTAGNDQYSPEIDWDGTHHIIVWSDNRNSNLDIYGDISEDALLVEKEVIKPTTFCLLPCYPNPFNSSINIVYKVERQWKGAVIIEIYDILGKKVRTILQNKVESGYNRAFWNGANDIGKIVCSGVYFVRLKAGDEFEVTNSILFLK